MIINQLSVFVENKPGRLAQVTQTIAEAGVDIRAISIADTSDFGILRLIVNDPNKAAAFLKNAGMTVSLTDVVAVGIEDSPGSFAKIIGLLSDSGISIEYMYALISRFSGQDYVIMRIENPERGVEVLLENKIRLLTNEEVYNM